MPWSERAQSSLINMGFQPSDGAVQNWIVKAGQLLADDRAANRQSIVDAEVAHFDESGMRIGGKLNGPHGSGHWKRRCITRSTPSGVREAMDAAGLLPHFQGNAVHDHWKSYWSYTHCTHSLCNAHHLRELRYCQELTGHFWPFRSPPPSRGRPRGGRRRRAAGQTTLESGYVADLLARYDQQVKNGLAAYPVRPPEPGRKGRVKQHLRPPNLLLRLRDYKTQVWRFLTDWRVPFDNNRAERMVRPVKVKLKVIWRLPRLGGSTAFCILRSVWETNKLNGINPFDTLRLAFEGR
ncbi:MAG: transposase [Candidatus Competibacteraceae bacterium]|nr:transposase [Candidatus Competibacteraceae bacterium]